MTTRLGKCLLSVGSLILALLIAEVGLRIILLGKSEMFRKFRSPGLYADYYNGDDYWKLYYLFDGEYKPPANPHPLLGWIGDFQRNSLMHNKIAELGRRRPVLLYGDSYAQCAPGVSCFQELLNSDNSFSKDHYLLNYGVGGYGVDQIALLCRNTAHRYQRPIVIFSLMVADLDRTPLTVRTGQKPFVRIVDDSLVLSGVPIERNPADFFSTHPPEVTSYLWRRFLNLDLGILPKSLTAKLKGEKQFRDEKIRLNKKVLDAVVKDLRESGISFMFVVFHYIEPGNQQFSVKDENNWRDQFLWMYMEKAKVPFIWTKELIRKDPAYDGSNIDTYMILENGHPTTYLNGLIANQMQTKVRELEVLEASDASHSSQEWRLERDNLLYLDMIQAQERKIHDSPELMERVKRRAWEENLTVDRSVRDAAIQSVGQGPELYDFTW